MKNKTCSLCKIVKSSDCFCKDAKRKDGLYVYCRQCVAARMKIYRKQNNEKRTEYNKEYRDINREKYNVWERGYYKVNRKKMNKTAKFWRDHNGIFQILHIHCKSRARSKGWSYELSAEIIENLITSQEWRCALTGMKMETGSTTYGYHPFKPSVDRKDSSKGYELANIQIVCVIVNKAKNEYPVELFDRMCLARAKRIEK